MNTKYIHVKMIYYLIIYYLIIIVKPADKGGAVVVWGREQYIQEGLRKLTNPEYYLALTANPLESMTIQLTNFLSTAKDNNWISQKEYDFLLCKDPRVPSFYMLPKIHRNLESLPGRPIISGNGSLTESASQYVDFFIKPYVCTLPSYIQDSTHVLNKINDMKSAGESLLVTMDVESLYTNIDHVEGLEAVEHFFE